MPLMNEERLAALSPTAFENLVFDLIRADSMENLHWRTPGADGGRDIEGELSIQDFSGYSRKDRWLIECKRYQSAVDWPTVFPKVAYADNNHADFLLMVTSGKFSTRCLDEIEKWNTRKRKPVIRVWPGHEVIFRLSLKPAIAGKYGLIDNEIPSAIDVSKLALHIARMSQGAIAHTDIVKVNRYVFAVSCLSRLLYVRSEDLSAFKTFRKSTPIFGESLPYFVEGVSTSELDHFDWIGLSAYIACLFIITKSLLKANINNNGAFVLSSEQGLPATLVDIALLREVAFWSNLTVTGEDGTICLMPQNFV